MPNVHGNVLRERAIFEEADMLAYGRLFGRLGRVAAAALALATVVRAEDEDYARWYFSPSVGALWMEGDDPLKSGFFLEPRLGYDLSEWWSFELGCVLAPSLQENEYNDYSTGEPVPTSESEGPDRDFGRTWMAMAYGDALLHFTRWERLDPFLSGGLGLMYYGKKVLARTPQTQGVLRLGGGFMWHFNDVWAFRADGRIMLATDDDNVSSLVSAGLVWTWGARVPPDIVASGGPIDSDNDGLSDRRESDIGTDPYDPDTDKDELTDGQEVNVYRTDPLNPDTDYDGLKDGAEVLRHKTDPLLRDTDNGGVADGHEVLEDRTDPLNGNDDLMLFELYIQFDYDQAVIKPPYFKDLNVIAKVLERHPKSTTLIEGHADRLRTSTPEHNKLLSERRAQAVLDYLAGKSVARERMRAVGYGYDRPREKPDIVNGTPNNRRVEVYIRGAGGKAGKEEILRTMAAEP
jgi:outer membrane protein OmpA-like peptidoglycan-associated protein